MSALYILIIHVICAVRMSSQNKQEEAILTPFVGVKPSYPRHFALRQGIPDTSTSELPKKLCLCSKIYDPICASSKRSYYNLCQMECDVGNSSNVTILHQGNCIPF